MFNAKINSKWVTGLDLIMFLQFYNIIKLLGRNMGESIWCLGPGKEFLDLTPKYHRGKVNKLDLIKIKNFCSAKILL